MTIPVDIIITDDAVSPSPIEGVMAIVVAKDSSVVLATGMSNSSGAVSFALPGSAEGIDYEVRFFKLGVIFNGPCLIDVIDPVPDGQTNRFVVQGTLLTIPIATDPRVCRCTGRFMSMSNRPLGGVVVRFKAVSEIGHERPKIVDNNLIANQTLHVATNNEGFASVDLIRGGIYYVTFAGNDDDVWNLTVPDRASANLIDLIFPYPVVLNWDQEAAPANAISFEVGEQVEVPFTMLFSDFQERAKDLTKYVTFVNSDNEVAKLSISDVRMVATLEGLKPGVSEIVVETKEGLLPSRVPPYSVQAHTLLVTVTCPC
jgi:hypothetical protein